MDEKETLTEQFDEKLLKHVAKNFPFNKDQVDHAHHVTHHHLK